MLPLLLILAPPQAVALPEWLAGSWCTEGAEKRTCEQWAPPAGGGMLGQGYVEEGQARRATEDMRIAAEPQGLAFYGQPRGEAAVRFAAVEVSATRLVFAAPAHDYPKRIEYLLEGDILVATVSGADPAKDSMTWRYRRIAESSRK
ncbi:MAG TPA: DUF6265 family protein [Sphingomonas sp.]|nr:DUF6265 family protein [Sphingomonas sp.]